MNNIFLSIILPAHNEENRLPNAFRKLDEFLSKQPYRSEVLVVENGSQDRTYALAQEYGAKKSYIRVIREQESGKGRAIRRGMLESIGDYRFYCDVDFSMPVDLISKFIPPANPIMDISIGSREVPGAIRFNEPLIRHYTGRIFNKLVRQIALPDIQDSQCGFKCFRAEVAEKVFLLQTINGWTFDVEVLFIARKLGYGIKEIPVPWFYNPDSKIRILHDSYRMFTDLIQIRINDARGYYYSNRY